MVVYIRRVFLIYEEVFLLCKEKFVREVKEVRRLGMRFHIIDGYFKMIFSEDPKQGVNIVRDFIIPKVYKGKVELELEEVIAIKEEQYIKMVPDFLCKIRIENRSYLFNIEFQSRYTKEIIYRSNMYNLVLSRDVMEEVISVVLVLDRALRGKGGVFLGSANKGITISKRKVITNEYKVLCINLMNEEVKEKVRRGNYLGVMELIKLYEEGYKKEVLMEVVEEIDKKIEEGEYEEGVGRRLKIIIGALYIEKGLLDIKEVYKVLNVRKEDYIELYKRNPIIKDIADTAYEQILKQMEANYEEILKQKEKEIIEMLIKIRLKEDGIKLLLEIEKEEDINKLNKIKKILELDLTKEEYIRLINEIISMK